MGERNFLQRERCIVNSCSSSNNYIKRTEHIFACVSLLSLIRKYCGQWCPPREWKHTQEKRVVKRRLMVGKRGTSWTRQCLRPARNFWFYIFICSLSHTQILIEFIVTTFMFVAFMFLSSLFVSMSKMLWTFMIKLHTLGGWVLRPTVPSLPRRTKEAFEFIIHYEGRAAIINK